MIGGARNLAIFASVLIIAGCGASPAITPGPIASAEHSPAAAPGATAVAPSAGATAPPDGQIGFDSLFPADLFSAPSDPLNLTPTPTGEGAMSATIGPDGGQLSTSGPDGTTYVLVVPAGALPVATTLTATPLADVTGFPFDTEPDTRVGVSLTPSGLEFAVPARLTITPASGLPEAGVATLGYRGEGYDAGLELAEQSAGTLALEVEHFSGYVAAWPIEEPEWRALARQKLEAKESFLRHVMAVWLGFRRTMINAGADPRRFATDVDFARGQLPEWVKEVLEPRIQAAANGCREGEDAMQYWIAYWRQAQLLGVAGDADNLGDSDFFVTINGQTYTSIYDFPRSLLASVVENCFFEDYQRCVASGDFFLLYRRLFGLERSFQLLGQEFQTAWIDLMVGYLQRCGQWKFDVASQFAQGIPRDNVLACCAASGEISRTIDVKWTAGPGSGMAKVYGAKIEGQGDLRFDRITFEGTSLCTVSVKKPSQLQSAEAALRSLEWEYPDDPAAPDWAESGYPTRLVMSLHLGSGRTEYTVRCRGAPRAFTFPFPFDDAFVGIGMFAAGYAVADPDDAERFPLMFATGWEFQGLNPFRAHLVREASFDNGVSDTSVRVEMTLRHSPQ